jgi:hypothetical protein
MTTNQKYIVAGLVLLMIISKGKAGGTGCGCTGTASGGATKPDKPAEWWTYAGQWSV